MTPRQVRMLRIGLLLAIPAALAIAGIFSWVLVRGPRMQTQPHLRTYEAVMPLPPEGSLPREGYFKEIEAMGEPPAGGDESRLRGGIYYRYYCVFCHGEDGSGSGPVGDSYMPVPSDLRSDRIRGYPDERLRRAMIEGTGHAPVLERVVPMRFRGDLVVYVRSLGGQGER